MGAAASAFKFKKATEPDAAQQAVATFLEAPAQASAQAPSQAPTLAPVQAIGHGDTNSGGFKGTFESMYSAVIESIDNKKWTDLHSPDPIKKLRKGVEWLKTIDGPQMWLIESTTIEKLGHIPIHSEALKNGWLLTLEEAIDKFGHDPKGPLMETCFLSHNWCHGPAHSLIDDEGAHKAKFCVRWAKWFNAVQQRPEGTPTLWWIDWACIDQDNSAPGAAMLPCYIKLSKVIACFVHAEKYFSRGWCRMERTLFTAMNSPRNWFYFLDQKDGASAAAFLKALDDPREGDLTCAADREYIIKLTEAAFLFYEKNYENNFDGSNNYHDKKAWGWVSNKLDFDSKGYGKTHACAWDFTASGFVGKVDTF